MPKHVVVYGTPTCPFCIRLKQYLKDNNIVFEDVDLGKYPEKVAEMVEKSGQMGVPVIDIDGEIIVGFDREKISSLLDIA